jgi:hypothetical protein
VKNGFIGQSGRIRQSGWRFSKNTDGAALQYKVEIGANRCKYVKIGEIGHGGVDPCRDKLYPRDKPEDEPLIYCVIMINTFHMYSRYIMLVGPDLFRHVKVLFIPCGASKHYYSLHTHQLHLTPLRTPYQTVIFHPIDNKNGFYTHKLVYNTLHGSRDALYHPCGCPRPMQCIVSLPGITSVITTVMNGISPCTHIICTCIY